MTVGYTDFLNKVCYLLVIELAWIEAGILERNANFAITSELNDMVIKWLLSLKVGLLYKQPRLIISMHF